MSVLRSVIFVTFLALIACAPETLVGTDLGAQAAPDFTLTDGRSGSTVSLASLRGSVVALAFLYTKCPDTCPLTAEHFRAAQQQLGGDADRVRFVAVSVDPAGDTPASVRDFSASHRLDRNWYYLIGPANTLKPVWAAYGIRQEPDPSGLVGHTDAIYLIDAKGDARVLLHTVDGAETLLKDLRILLREKQRSGGSDATEHGAVSASGTSPGCVTRPSADPSPDDVDGREEADPDDIDEVPVDARALEQQMAA